eukprot:TRINITY_DN5811_c0_g1_i1.p1 TRINITY_DN5811_c0_g1~~TRINITY_DN5811_c0_g1_i1.p1  ORF type:complete len:396 (-),score=86.32 TRINITY_DN5811_c0_g1_i1:155-1342(-)
MATSEDEVAQLRETIARLTHDLEAEKVTSGKLAAELRIVKERALRQVADAEMEEESIANRLLKKVNNLQQEKEKLVMEVEREEEMLTNNLQKKLDALRREKVAVENQLEIEQEYITNKLQKQLRTVQEEKHLLEQRWEQHTQELVGQLNEHEQSFRMERMQLQAQLETEEESLTNRLTKQMDAVRKQHQETRREAELAKEKNATMRRALDKLRAENYALKLKIGREEERRHQLMSEKVMITQHMEADSERQFNRMSATAPVDTRDRSYSEPPLMFPMPPGYLRSRAPSWSSMSSRGSISSPGTAPSASPRSVHRDSLPMSPRRLASVSSSGQSPSPRGVPIAAASGHFAPHIVPSAPFSAPSVLSTSPHNHPVGYVQHHHSSAPISPSAHPRPPV